MFFVGTLWGAIHYRFYLVLNWPDTVYTQKLVVLGLLVGLLDFTLLLICCASAYVVWTGEPLTGPTRMQQLRRRTVF
jgi:hypothetical protein